MGAELGATPSVSPSDAAVRTFPKAQGWKIAGLETKWKCRTAAAEATT